MLNREPGTIEPCFEVKEKKEEIVITNKGNGQSKIFKMGTDAWRLLYFTQFRNNSEICNKTSSKIPWDVQQDIAYLAWLTFDNQEN